MRVGEPFLCDTLCVNTKPCINSTTEREGAARNEVRLAQEVLMAISKLYPSLRRRRPASVRRARRASPHCPPFGCRWPTAPRQRQWAPTPTSTATQPKARGAVRSASKRVRAAHAILTLEFNDVDAASSNEFRSAKSNFLQTVSKIVCASRSD